MRAGDYGRLFALAAIWGAAFLFIRIVAPVLGPVLTSQSRTLVAGVALAIYFWFTGFDPRWRRWGGQYVVVGMLNSGFPFLLYAYAALSLPAGLMAVLNATSPMWGALLAALLLGERLSARRSAGLVLGIAGVVLISRPQPGESAALLAIGAALAACFLYGFAGVYLKRWAREIPVRGLALGTQLSAGVLLIPFVPLSPPSAAPDLFIAACVVVLGLVCGAVAYLLYFRLIADIGPTRALTVTYLIPIFGVLWGALFLNETFSAAMLGGAGLVILGTVLVLRN